MEKVREPEFEEVWQCPRCHQGHCGNCVDREEVDFDIADAPESFGRDNESEVQWKGLSVCPWCYNQLVEKQIKKGDD